MNLPIKFSKLKKSGPLMQLLARARVLAALDRQLKHLLEVPLRDHCQVLALHDRQLVVAADSPAWAARLRFHSPQLARKLSRDLPVPVRSVRIRVLPVSGEAPPAGHPATVRRRGPEGKRALLQAVQTVSDPELKTALRNLASHYLAREDP
jgi:hypothetical protein